MLVSVENSVTRMFKALSDAGETGQSDGTVVKAFALHTRQPWSNPQYHIGFRELCQKSLPRAKPEPELIPQHYGLGHVEGHLHDNWDIVGQGMPCRKRWERDMTGSSERRAGLTQCSGSTPGRIWGTNGARDTTQVSSLENLHSSPWSCHFYLKFQYFKE